MSCSDLPPYILQELPDITRSINYPIQNVQRIKYTCFDVSKSLIAFGATSGGIYIFSRTPCEFVQLIPNKVAIFANVSASRNVYMCPLLSKGLFSHGEGLSINHHACLRRDGPVTRLAISKHEKQIGFANGRGLATVTDCNQSLSGSHSAIVSKEHYGNEITAMIWSTNHMLFMGDDVGKISVLQPQNFIAKTMFQSSSLTIMSLDSRICQLDMKSCMLLVSTLTRCYVCDTSQEQYRQIGQKLRDGEYGACFVDKKANNEQQVTKTTQDITEVRKYNIVSDDSGFAVGKDLENTLIFCARPSSRVWEATIDGTVIRTHQFKQILGKKAMKFVSNESYQNEKVSLDASDGDTEGQSVNFPNIFATNGAIFSYKRNALYFLNIYDVDHTIWFDNYKDIVDCKVYHDVIYVWLSNGSLVNLKYMKVDKFLVKCYVDEKYVLCAELCALYRNYLLESNLSQKLHILVSLKDKLENKDILDSIKDVLDKFEGLKSNDATQLESGIYIVDNTYNAQSSLLESDTKSNDDFKFTSLPPEAMQTLKDLSSSVSDKLNSSKKILKEKWEGFEGKMKHLSTDKQQEVKDVPVIDQHQEVKDVPVVEQETQDVIKAIDKNENIEQHITPIVYDKEIIYKESSQKAVEIDNNSLERDKVIKNLYKYYKLSTVGRIPDPSTLVDTIENYTCDISQIYTLMLQIENHCIDVGAVDESKFVPNKIFLTYISESKKKDELLDMVINDELLYKYFVDSCISVNVQSEKLWNISCDCGFPLPYSRSRRIPMFSELIDEFIEKQWSSQTKGQCYDACKRMPYLWRKILYLRRNEDLMTILRILLQMLDETLLHTFLPQFTLDTWERTVQLYATLHGNMCLNCTKKFDHVIVKDTLSWDGLGKMMIKSIGGRNALKLMEKYANLVADGAMTVRFYHTCLMVTMYEKYDPTIVGPLIETMYSCYSYADSREEICKILRSTLDGIPENTALPILAAAKSHHWGLRPVTTKVLTDDIDYEIYILDASMNNILNNLSFITRGLTDCVLCGLPLHNSILLKEGGLWVFKCGHTFHGACLESITIKLCPTCSPAK